MSSQDRKTFARNVMANISVAGFLAVGAAVALSATAAADDGPPPDPALVADPAPAPLPLKFVPTWGDDKLGTDLAVEIPTTRP